MTGLRRGRNAVKTTALLALLTALIIVVGGLVAGSTGVVVATVLSLGLNAYLYFNSDKLALRSMAARQVSPQEAPELYAVVAELSQRAGQPMPRIYVSPIAQPNAFATGRNPEHAAVAVTAGILQLLSPRELRAVLGHELAHVYNRDILTSSVAAGLAGIVTMLANLAIFLPFGSSDDDDAPNPLVTLLTVLFAPIAASLIQLAISRNREYEADHDGAELSGDPLALASALAKISRGTTALPLPAESGVATQSHLMIANPLSGHGIGALFSTHPPMDERIRRLHQLAANPHVLAS
ncbi:peptidase M48 Ste24p [Kribbella flavida DSM 17836]|uniref:Protease HtpX homolog n=1 Tax=Kribbella flavida (strain DSM 17836 / JCM 10339 / NBRC 14399) TaxID=479435 RepID=D2PZR7_KRIFD|nr:zinc metalloprotease HtpX [Kribbella flavida]ADB35633.1 peptidase M48 Ste24p [Kribbella flavida DSM 17836]